MGQNQFIISIVLIVIFTIAFVNFGTQFGIEQGSVIKISDDPNMSRLATSVETDMGTFTTTTNENEDSFAKSSIEDTSQSGTLVTGSIFKSTPVSPLTSMKRIFGAVYSNIFGGDSDFDIILTIITSLVIVISIALAWKTWKGGNPD